MFVVVFAPSAVAAAAKAREARGKKRREKREGWEKGKFLRVAFRSTSFQNLFVSLSSSLSNFFFFQNPLKWMWVGDVYNRKVYCIEWKKVEKK